MLSLRGLKKAYESGEQTISISPVDTKFLEDLEAMSTTPTMRSILQELESLLPSSHLSVEKTVTFDSEIAKSDGSRRASYTVSDISSGYSKESLDCYNLEVLKFAVECLRAIFVTGLIVVSWRKSDYDPNVQVPQIVDWDKVNVFSFREKEDISSTHSAIKTGLFAVPVQWSISSSPSSSSIIPEETPYFVFNVNGTGSRVKSRTADIVDELVTIGQIHERLSDAILQKSSSVVWVQRTPKTREDMRLCVGEGITGPSGLSARTSMPSSLQELISIDMASTWKSSKDEQNEIEKNEKASLKRKLSELDGTPVQERMFAHCESTKRQRLERERVQTDKMTALRVLPAGLHIAHVETRPLVPSTTIQEMQNYVREMKNSIASSFGLGPSHFRHRGDSREIYEKTAKVAKARRRSLASWLQRMVAALLNTVYRTQNTVMTKREILKLKEMVLKEELPDGVELGQEMVGMTVKERVARVAKVTALMKGNRKLSTHLNYIGSGNESHEEMKEMFREGFLRYEPLVETLSDNFGIPLSSFRPKEEYFSSLQHQIRCLSSRDRKKDVVDDIQDIGKSPWN